MELITLVEIDIVQKEKIQKADCIFETADNTFAYWQDVLPVRLFQIVILEFKNGKFVRILNK